MRSNRTWIEHGRLCNSYCTRSYDQRDERRFGTASISIFKKKSLPNRIPTFADIVPIFFGDSELLRVQQHTAVPGSRTTQGLYKGKAMTVLLLRISLVYVQCTPAPPLAPPPGSPRPTLSHPSPSTSLRHSRSILIAAAGSTTTSLPDASTAAALLYTCFHHVLLHCIPSFGGPRFHGYILC